MDVGEAFISRRSSLNSEYEGGREYDLNNEAERDKYPDTLQLQNNTFAGHFHDLLRTLCTLQGKLLAGHAKKDVDQAREVVAAQCHKFMQYAEKRPIRGGPTQVDLADLLRQANVVASLSSEVLACAQKLRSIVDT